MITIEPKVKVDEGCKRTYQLSIVNTNTHDYTGIGVDLALAKGVTYLQPHPNTPAPTLGTNSDGGVTLTWRGLRVPAAGQVVLEVDLEAAASPSAFGTPISTSPVDVLPHKEGVPDPVVPGCTDIPPPPPGAMKVLLPLVRY